MQCNAVRCGAVLCCAVQCNAMQCNVILGTIIKYIKKVICDLRSEFTILIGIKKPETNQGFNGIRTRDLRDTGAMLYQLSYEATHCDTGAMHRTGIAEVRGSNPVEALICFRLLYSNCGLEIHCEDHISPSYISAVHISILYLKG